jgi:anti-sigma B factor antagonist
VEIKVERQGAVTVIKPDGPLCAEDADKLKNLLRENITRSLGRVVVDSSAISFVDSRGLEAFADVADLLSESGQALKLCGSGDLLREVFTLTELDPLFEHFDDVNSAVRSFM